MCLLFVRCVCSCQQRVCGLVELALCHLNAVWDVFRNMIWFGFIAGTMRQKQKTPPSCDPSNMIKPTAPGLSPSDSCALPAGRAAEHLSGEADCWPVSLSPASKGPLIRWRDDIDISIFSLARVQTVSRLLCYKMSCTSWPTSCLTTRAAQCAWLPHSSWSLRMVWFQGGDNRAADGLQ